MTELLEELHLNLKIIHSHSNGKWFFWTETLADEIGPFDTERICAENLVSYVRFLSKRFGWI